MSKEGKLKQIALGVGLAILIVEIGLAIYLGVNWNEENVVYSELIRKNIYLYRIFKARANGIN